MHSNQEPASVRRHRRPALPQLADIEALISQARALRLKLVELAAIEPLAGPSKEGVESLSKVGMQLERIIELVASAKTRRRRSATQKP